MRLKIAATVLTVLIIIMTVVFVGIPGDIRPFGTRTIKVADHVWLDFPLGENLPQTWDLVLNTRQDEVKIWDDEASGEVIVDGVSQYDAVRSWLIVVKYRKPGVTDRWHRLDLSQGPSRWDDKDFDSEAALTNDIAGYGITEPLHFTSVRKPLPITVGDLSLIIIAPTLTGRFLLGAYLRRRQSAARGFAPAPFEPSRDNNIRPS